MEHSFGRCPNCPLYVSLSPYSSITKRFDSSSAFVLFQIESAATLNEIFSRYGKHKTLQSNELSCSATLTCFNFVQFAKTSCSVCVRFMRNGKSMNSRFTQLLKEGYFMAWTEPVNSTHFSDNIFTCVLNSRQSPLILSEQRFGQPENAFSLISSMLAGNARKLRLMQSLKTCSLK